MVHTEILLLIMEETSIFVVGVLNTNIKAKMNEIVDKIFDFSSAFDELKKDMRSQSVPNQQIDTFVTRVFAVREIDLSRCTITLGH